MSAGSLDAVGVYAVAFAVTFLVEVPINLGWLTRRFGVPARRVVPVTLLANLLTHPALWLLMRGPAVAELGYPLVFLGAETLVCLLEWGVFVYAVRVYVRRAEPAAALTAGQVGLVVVCANTASAAVGLVGSLLR